LRLAAVWILEKQKMSFIMQLNSEHTDQPIGSSPNGSKPPVVGSTVILGDCVEVMKGFDDNQFDLAIVDPPYGIGAGDDVARHKFKDSKKDWDKKVPTHKYFDELFRVSKNQIIWGANYMLGSMLPSVPQLKDMNTQCFIVWDKKQPEKFSLAMAEYAWTSFNRPAKIFRYSNKNDGNKIHPTQKPIELYKWILKNFAENGQRILDTHLGSGSSRIAADKAGLDFTGIEIDKEYFDLSEKRFKQYKSQLRIEGW
jgi:site-specific DNA-methyltransferase (adenine-specific)